MSLEAIPYIVVLGIMYGTTLTAASFGVGQFASMTFIAIRLVLASMAYLLIFTFSVRGYSFPRDKTLWKHAIFLGVFGTAVPMNMIAGSLYFVSSGVAGILITIGPAITVVLAHLFLSDERLNRRKVIGVVLAFSGTIILTILGESGLPDVRAVNPVGYILLLIGLLSSNSMNIYVRLHMADFDFIQVSAARMFTAAVVTLPISILFVGFDLSQVNLKGWFVLGWTALFGTFAAVLLAFYNVQRFGATAAAIVSYLVPIISSLLGVILLGETITSGMLVSMVVIILGVMILNERPRRKIVGSRGVDELV